ncbi:protein Aster-B-like [Panonychus citri]|uniref:protein Aster-B-like n=1 Tax=Panonychus citri TaxID=50023 RepID=UPI0023079F21|nr:protein Aster-B-like [Panonychus citri]XP_053203035.1 protein Aster-B-like [Panonychus citri]
MVKLTINQSACLGNQSMDKQVNPSESKIKVKMNNNKFRMKNFEKLFGKQIGLNERLIADYSGAILRDMIIAGRLYITSSYLCFYGSLLKWETKIVIRLSDISSIIKAKTIKVIPNAIQIVTRTGDKYVFTSLTSRQKVYKTLVSIWTANVSHELANYDSDTDKSSIDSSIRKCYSNLESGSKRISDSQVTNSKLIKSKRKYFSTGDLADTKFINNFGGNLLSTFDPMPDKSPGINKKIRDPAKCPHTESCLADVVLPIHLNRLFEMLFTDSPFISMFTKSLKHTVTMKREWSVLTESDLQQSGGSMVAVRQLSREMILDYPFAKNMSSEEMMYLEHFDPSNFYSIKLISESSGVPLCSLFNVASYYCLHRTANPSETHLHFHYKVEFKSKAWGFRSFIEEGTKRACQDYIDSLLEMIKKWSMDNPDYIVNPDFPSQLKPFNNELLSTDENQNDREKTCNNQQSIVNQPIAQSTSKLTFAQMSNMEKIESNQTNCLSPSIQNENFTEKSSSPDCNGHFDDQYLLNIVKYLKPLIVFLLILTIINLFLMIRLINTQILSSSSFCPSNQVSSQSSFIGLSGSDETFESLTNYGYNSLGCRR